jgi:hypothetical protein
MKRPKQFKKQLNKGRCLHHYNSIIYDNLYYRWIFQYDNIHTEFGIGKYQGIKLEVNLK